MQKTNPKKGVHHEIKKPSNNKINVAIFDNTPIKEKK